MEHTNKRYSQELSELSAGVTRMGNLVVEQIDGALRCLAEHDIGAARAIVERDAGVNHMDIELEEMCLNLLALHQPVAGDLRLIAAAMKITTELERVGDRVVNICEAVHDRDERDSPGSHAEISRMGALAAAMVRDSMAAFSGIDSSLARRVIEKDREFDALYGETFAKLTAPPVKDSGEVAHDARMAFLSKDLNEISEHATNIAETVMFMIDGKQVTHMDLHERRKVQKQTAQAEGSR